MFYYFVPSPLHGREKKLNIIYHKTRQMSFFFSLPYAFLFNNFNTNNILYFFTLSFFNRNKSDSENLDNISGQYSYITVLQCPVLKYSHFKFALYTSFVNRLFVFKVFLLFICFICLKCDIKIHQLDIYFIINHNSYILSDYFPYDRVPWFYLCF